MNPPWLRPDGGPWIIAEIGVNHDGDPELAHQLIAAAAEAGADAVKFQTFQSDHLVSSAAPAAPYQRDRVGFDLQAEMLQGLELDASVWPELSAAAIAAGLSFLSTAFDRDSLVMIDALEPVAHKVPSGEITNLEYLDLIARMGRPVIISTGMANVDEITAALDHFSNIEHVAVLHCVTAYPAPIEEVNLRSIPYLAERLHRAIGWSDHTTGSVAAVAAVALGAAVVERHLTHDRRATGPDHAASDEPDEFAAYVADARASYAALGHFGKSRSAAEAENAAVARRSWHVRSDLSAGTVLEARHLVALRPASGVPVDNDLVGRMLRTDVKAGEPLQMGDIEEPS